MKSLKVLLTVLALGVATSAPLLRAQEEKPAAPAGGGERPRGQGRAMQSPEQRVERLDKAVTLTAEQKTKALDIYKKAADQAKALSPEERREKGMEIMKATGEQIRALLTPEQQAKFDAMPRGGPGGGDRKPKKNK